MQNEIAIAQIVPMVVIPGTPIELPWTGQHASSEPLLDARELRDLAEMEIDDEDPEWDED